MQDLVSTRWVRALGLAASLELVWAIFIPSTVPGTSLAWASLVLVAALLLLRSGSVHEAAAIPARTRPDGR